MERVRISASELRGILATLAPQAGSRGESHRPAPGPGLPAPPPSPLVPPPAPSAALRSPRPFPQQWGRGAEGGPPRRPTSPRACVGLRSASSGPLRTSPARVPASAPFLTAKVTVSPLPQSSQTSPWIPSSRETPKGVGSGVWWRPRVVSLPEESSAGLPRHLLSVGEKELGKLRRKV